jgi:hypothetical protein
MSPDVGELCSRGETAFENNDYEEAVAWYELACAGTYVTQYVRGDTRAAVPHPFATLIERRFDRYAELRKMLPWRSVQRLAKPDPGHVLAVQTVVKQHRGERDLDLRAWARWPFEKILEADGNDGGPLQGQAKTLFRIFKRATMCTPFTYLTLLEDDVVLAKNALDYIATTRMDDDLAFTAWFSQETCTIPRIQPVLSCRPALHYDCNQAITFPARTVHELLASDALKNWNEPHGADRLYARVFPKRPVAVHFPNLVQHVGGLASLVGNKGARVSPSFIGEDVDALGLIR